jgi:hypothetical protein
MIFLRLPLAALAATVLTFSMFGVMNALTNVRTESGEAVAVAKIEFVRLRQEVEVEEKKREKIERVKPEQAPVVPTISVA